MPVMLRKLDTARTASAAWKASAKKWRKYWHWRAGYCAAAEKRVAALEDALKFYADTDTYERVSIPGYTTTLTTSTIWVDKGAKANAALNKD